MYLCNAFYRSEAAEYFSFAAVPALCNVLPITPGSAAKEKFFFSASSACPVKYFWILFHQGEMYYLFHRGASSEAGGEKYFAKKNIKFTT